MYIYIVDIVLPTWAGYKHISLSSWFKSQVLCVVWNKISWYQHNILWDNNCLELMPSVSPTDTNTYTQILCCSSYCFDFCRWHTVCRSMRTLRVKLTISSIWRDSTKTSCLTSNLYMCPYSQRNSSQVSHIKSKSWIHLKIIASNLLLNNSLKSIFQPLL